MPRPALYISICYYVAELFFLPMEVRNTVRTWSGEDPVFLPPAPPLSPSSWALEPHIQWGHRGQALAKACPRPRREVPPRVPGICFSVVSIVSLELAHNENKFCLIFACVPHFFHPYHPDIR